MDFSFFAIKTDILVSLFSLNNLSSENGQLSSFYIG